ncbi:LiaI-LiaF-like domain-containing protein [Siphonobacter sp. SORGH_AS_0500]|uniref:LiaI-LiaF-like domain-containing protein n=1 Tax=Siphonobacter sp. SORGH_AS_0500 TaxID=1864824 RepID=UPI0028605707|nr:DUF5668 domain-containing protein [Siphonobacter sp. SORGH_AS_0500]MDR6196471.1 hypothetical protein [Siphonobacter sp. SORGH_AS_0500]
MKPQSIIIGAIFILVGFLFLGRNMDWFDFHFSEIFRFWPLLFVVLGLNMILGKSNRAVTVIVLVLLGICIPIFIATKVRDKVRDEVTIESSWSDDDHEEEEDIEESVESHGGGKQYLAEPMTDSIESATFRLEGGAAEFTMGTTDKELVEADGNLDFGNLSLKSMSGSGSNEVVLAMKGKGNWKLKEHTHNDVAIRLNPKPVWDLDMQVGAGKVDFDLTPFNVQKVRLKTGAAEMELKLGDKADLADVDVNAGLASIKIMVPEGVGCRITTNGALTDKKFNGFVRDGNEYETSNYNSAAKKINIKFNGGIAEWEVERY